MSDRSIYWSVTINNPKTCDEENIATARTRGWIVEGQKELGENGTPHYQLAVNCKSQQRFSALKKVFPRAHIEQARNPKALKTYVHKDETRIAELPNSDRYVTSQHKLWSLVVDELQNGEADKRHRILVNDDKPYLSNIFEPLPALDYACDALIRKGYHCVETMAVNPQVRSAWKTFWSAIIARRDIDRQTDRQAELISQSGGTTNQDDAQTHSESISEFDTQSETSRFGETYWEDDAYQSSSGEGSSDGCGSKEDC